MRRMPTPGWNDDPEQGGQTPNPVTRREIDQHIQDATKELGERSGIRGSLGHVGAGGARLAPGSGFAASGDGTPRSQIEPDGDVLLGSDISTPEGTSFLLFANDQEWNAEQMEAGDILIGDNSDDRSNIKWDASEGQWQFRLGTTVKAYMDTDGSIKFGGGDGFMDEFGLYFRNQEGEIGFEDLTTGGFSNVRILINSGDHLVLENKVGEKAVIITVDDASHNAQNYSFTHTGLDITAGLQYMIDGTPHTHTGAEGGVSAENNANDIFAVTSPGGTSAFAGTINGAPSGTSVVYTPVSGTEASMVPSNTTQLAKMRLYNTTRGNSALISNCNTGTNTITLTANAPANWANGDTITIASQTVSGGGFNWVDLELTGLAGKSALFVNTQINSATVGHAMRIHPFDASFSLSKNHVNLVDIASQNSNAFGLIKITSDLMSLSWTGTPAAVIIREAGYIA